jgi:hypothetical protein
MRSTPRFARLFIGWLLLTLASIASLFGQEQVFKGDNCAITPPDGWPALTGGPANPAILGRFANADRSGLLMVMCKDGAGNLALDDKFIASFEKGREQSSGITRISGQFIQASGTKGYEELGKVTVNGQPASSLSRTFLADGKVYDLEALDYTGDASKNPAIVKSFDSFRFLTPPAAPVTGLDHDDVSSKIADVVVVILVVLVVLAGGRRLLGSKN